jgi:hypothetical protein
MSWLPVPRNPETVHVSMISASAAGKSTIRACGGPSSWTRHPPMSHPQCWQPLAKRQRPVTR